MATAPQTGEKFKDRPYYSTWWFEWLMLLLSGGMAWILWSFVDQHWALNAGISNQFVELATNLATGKGYVLIEHGEAVPYLENPPLYPFLLSLLMQAYQTTNVQQLLEPIMNANLGLYLLSVMLVFRLLNMRIKKGYAFLVTFLYASSPFTLSAAESISPELLFLVLSLLTVGAIDKYFMKAEKLKQQPIWKIAICVLFVVATMLTKNLGIVLMWAFFAMLLKRQAPKTAFITLGMILLLMSPWYFNDIAQRNLSSHIAHRVQQTKASAYPLVSPFRNPNVFLDQLLANADAASAQMTEATLGVLDFRYMVNPAIQQTGVNTIRLAPYDFNWVRWTVASFMLLGTLFAISQFAGVVGLYFLMFMLLNLFFPMDGRLSLFPVYPMMLFALFNGVLWLGRGFTKVKVPFSNVAVPLLAALIIFNAMNQHFNTLAARKNGDIVIPEEKFTAEGVKEAHGPSGYMKAMDWLQRHTSRQAKVATDTPEDVVLFSQRRGKAIKAEPPEKLAQDLSRDSDYVIHDQNAPSSAHVQAAVQGRPSKFKLVYQDLKNKIKIWKVNKDDTPPAPSY